MVGASAESSGREVGWDGGAEHLQPCVLTISLFVESPFTVSAAQRDVHLPVFVTIARRKYERFHPDFF